MYKLEWLYFTLFIRPGIGVSNFVCFLICVSSSPGTQSYYFQTLKTQLYRTVLFISLLIMSELSSDRMYKQERQCTCKRNVEALSYKHCCSGKAISITYSECVSVALDIQHAKCMHRIILSSLSSLTVSYYSTLPYNRYDFWKTLLKMKYVC
jgi:hypothetical protein